MRTLPVWAAVTATSIAGASGAVAQPDDPRAVGARAACAAGEVETGIKFFAQILATMEDLTPVYNMCRCYRILR